MPKKEPKKKLTKAEKEKVKKDEAERKLLEEEEARIKAEEEEKLRADQEKIELAELKKLENQEKKVRKAQMVELDDIIQSNWNTLKEIAEERRKKDMWSRYMRCDGSPDPTNPGEINTYINLRKEERSRDSPDLVLVDIKLDLGLIAELEFILENMHPDEVTADVLSRYRETVVQLQEVVRAKLDAASYEVVFSASDLMDSTSYNLQFVIQNPEITLCIWGNLAKNLRIKIFEFSEVGVSFEIPRVLALSDCAVRILMTKHDHFSTYSKTYLPRIKKKEEIILEVKEEEIVEEGGGGEEEEKDGEGEGEEGQGEGRESTEDLMAQLRKMTGEEENEEGEEEKQPEEEEEEDCYEDPPTPEPQDWEDFEEDDEIVDLRAYSVMGSVFTIDLVCLPPQPKTVQEWTITRLMNPAELQYLEYEVDPSLLLPASSSINKEPKGSLSTSSRDIKDLHTPEKDKEKEKEKEKDKRDEKPPIGVTLKLPTDVMYQEEPQIARWDDFKKQWRLDGFSDIKYDEEKRTFCFKMLSFGTMALLQEVHINMPFQSWEIRPRSLNKAVFLIVAAIVELEIEIENSKCWLGNQFEDPALNHLKGKAMSPKALIKNLQSAGINVFPSEDSAKYVSIQNKHQLLEKRTYEQMALTASSMAYSWSKWNNEVADCNKILFQGAEHLVNERLLEEDWSLYQAGKSRVMELDMTEFDEAYSDTSRYPDQCKCSLYHVIMENSSEDARERITTSNYDFIDCVQQLLEATKVLTYS